MTTGEGLTDRQLTFIAEYCKDGNGTRAAIEAGYSRRTADMQASRLLKNVKVLTEVERRRNKRDEKFEVEASDILRQLIAIGGSDVRELFDADGNLRSIKDLPDHVAAAIASVEVVKRNITAGDKQVDTIYKVKLWPKVPALELLGRHKALFPKEPPTEVNVNVVVNTMSTAELEARAAALLEKRGLRLVKAS